MHWKTLVECRSRQVSRRLSGLSQTPPCSSHLLAVDVADGKGASLLLLRYKSYRRLRYGSISQGNVSSVGQWAAHSPHPGKPMPKYYGDSVNEKTSGTKFPRRAAGCCLEYPRALTLQLLLGKSRAYFYGWTPSPLTEQR